MKAIPTVLILNTRLGYCYKPLYFESRRQAIEYGRQAVESGFCWAYRVFNDNK